MSGRTTRLAGAARDVVAAAAAIDLPASRAAPAAALQLRLYETSRRLAALGAEDGDPRLDLVMAGAFVLAALADLDRAAAEREGAPCS